MHDAITSYSTGRQVSAALRALEETGLRSGALCVLSSEAAFRDELRPWFAETARAVANDREPSAYEPRPDPAPGPSLFRAVCAYVVGVDDEDTLLAVGSSLCASLLAEALSDGYEAPFAERLARVFPPEEARRLSQTLLSQHFILAVRVAGSAPEHVDERYREPSVRMVPFVGIPPRVTVHEQAPIEDYSGRLFHTEGHLFRTLNAARHHLSRSDRFANPVASTDDGRKVE